jgi:hypothetical protein
VRAGSWGGVHGARFDRGLINKTALLTVRPPIRLNSWHLLVSQGGLHFQQEYPSSLPAFLDFSFHSLYRSSILNLRCQWEMLSLQKHRCQPKFGTHVSTAPERRPRNTFSTLATILLLIDIVLKNRLICTSSSTTAVPAGAR